jgi:hypothetical protein
MYLKLRRRYWTDRGRKLPGLDRVLLGYLGSKEFHGRHVYDCRRRHNPDYHHYIVVNRDLDRDPDELRRTMLHEMAHLAVSEKMKKREKSHGWRWRKEVHRLRGLGADVGD